MMGICFMLMGQFVQSEVHCSSSTATEGVADCVVQTGDAIYLFEFKLSGSSSAEEALAQIKARHYAVPHRVSGKKLVLIGVSFDEEARIIKKWEVASG